MNVQIKATLLFVFTYLANAYNLNNQLAYWRLKRSFVLNNIMPKTAFPLVKYNNNVSIYSLHHEYYFDEYFVQHGEVPLID